MLSKKGPEGRSSDSNSRRLKNAEILSCCQTFPEADTFSYAETVTMGHSVCALRLTPPFITASTKFHPWTFLPKALTSEFVYALTTFRNSSQIG